MNSDASSDKEYEYGPTEFDQMIQDEFFDSLDSYEKVDMIMLMSMQEEMDRPVEHILNFKGSIKGGKRSFGIGSPEHGYCRGTTLSQTQLSRMIHGFVAVSTCRNQCSLAV